MACTVLDSIEDCSDPAVKTSKCASFAGKSIQLLEKRFYWLGIQVALYPWKIIVVVAGMFLACSSGMIYFSEVTDPEKTWLPPKLDLAKNADWVHRHFLAEFRLETVYFKSSNVLTPKALLQMLSIHERVLKIVSEGKTWTDICARIPVVRSNQRTRRSLNQEPPRAITSRSRRRRKKPSPLPTTTEALEEVEDVDDDYTDYGTLMMLNQTEKIGDVFWTSDDGSSDDGSSTFDPSVFFSRNEYCSILDSMETACFENSLLDIWDYNIDIIKELTENNILKAINTVTRSKVFGTKYNFTDLLGGIILSSDGQIISAKTAKMTWVVKIDQSLITEQDLAVFTGQSSAADSVTKAWELEFVNVLEDFKKHHLGDGESDVFLRVGRSYVDVTKLDEVSEAILRLSIGYTIVFIYAVAVLSNRNRLEHRIFLAIAGLLAVGLASAIANGICFYLGLMYGPVHKSLPFLLLGLGIDDMFVIAQSFDTLSEKEKLLPLEKQFGLVLKQAGVAITVTSFTDIVAFLVGSVTQVPMMKSFCIYAAIGIFVVYVLQATFFVACFSLDQRRIRDRRDACLLCVRVKEAWKPSQCSRRPVATQLFEGYSRFLMKTPVRLVALLLSASLVLYNIPNFIRLEIKMDDNALIPKFSYLHRFNEIQSAFYPKDDIIFASVYFGPLNYSHHLKKIHRFIQRLQNDTLYVQSVDSWTGDFIKWMNNSWSLDILKNPLSSDEFSNKFSLFLFSPTGGQYRSAFNFKSALECDNPNMEIEASRIDFRHIWISNNASIEVKMKVYNEMKDLIMNTSKDISGNMRLYSPAYTTWIVDQIIKTETVPSLATATVCVFFVVLFLVANITMSAMIFVSVLLTLVNVGGVMFLLGMTIDTIATIALTLAVGLSVDYSAHVGHSFMTVEGSRVERVNHVLTSVGPPVFSGGFSTFLAFSFIFGAQNRTLGKLSQIFISVTGFGLFNGLVFLPVILSFWGPKPYSKPYDQKIQDKNTPASSASTVHPSLGAPVPIMVRIARLMGKKAQPNSKSDILEIVEPSHHKSTFMRTSTFPSPGTLRCPETQEMKVEERDRTRRGISRNSVYTIPIEHNGGI